MYLYHIETHKQLEIMRTQTEIIAEMESIRKNRTEIGEQIAKASGEDEKMWIAQDRELSAKYIALCEELNA